MASKPPGSPPKLTDGNLLNSGKNELLIKVSYSEEFGTVAACKLDEFLLAVQSVRHQLIILLEMSIEHVQLISCLMLDVILCRKLPCTITFLFSCNYRSTCNSDYYSKAVYMTEFFVVKRLR